MKRPSTFGFLWLCCLMLLPCASVAGRQVETRTVWESGDGYIRLFREVGAAGRYDHPHTFHERDMARVLESVWFSTNRFFRWSPSMRVFEDEQAARLAPHFQRAFLEAGPEDRVEFYLTQTERSLLGVSGQTFLTRGRAFVRGHHLHMHFDNVQQKIRSYSTHTEDQDPLPPLGWKMVPRHGQSLGTLGPAGKVTKENVHWLTIDLTARPVPPAGSPQAPAAPAATRHTAPPGQSPAIRELPVEPGEPPPGDPRPVPATAPRDILRALKAMQEEGLISPEDYERKKQEILDRF